MSRILGIIKSVLTSRLFYIGLIFLALMMTLFLRLYNLQIKEGAETGEIQEYFTVKERYIPATRGNIYDSEGRLLAYNDLSYSVFLEESASLTTNKQKNEMINRLYKIIRSHGYEPEIGFSIYIDDAGKLQFNVSENAELRFKKNAYGKRTVDDLTEAQKNATAEEVFNFLAHGDKTAAMFQVSEDYTLEEALDIVTVRYQYFSNPDRTYQYTLLTTVDEGTMAALLEAQGDLPGVIIEQKHKRVYNYSFYLSHVIGYTGLVNETELSELNAETEGLYSAADAVGKTGIEKEFEKELAGTKGIERITLNDAGRIVSKEIIQEPVSGNDIYLTIDAELQKDYYYILENKIKDVLLDCIVNDMDYGTKGESSDDIKIPIYEVYYALFNNHLLSLKHIASDEASEQEKSTYALYKDYKQNVLLTLKNHFAFGNTTKAKKLSEDMQEFINFFYAQMKNNGFVVSSKIDTTDPMYIAYNADDTSFYEYMVHLINKECVSLQALDIQGEFLTTEEIYKILIEKTFDTLEDNENFDLMIYRDLIFDYKLKGRQICLLLFDQNVLEYNEKDYTRLANGKLSAYDFLTAQIEALNITPCQLALEPCSGYLVQTDCKTGGVIAIVNYPSYDNNMLANKIDWDYYQTLLNDKSNPLYNRVTQSRTPTGSTIKPMVAACGFINDVITVSEKIHDDILFDKIDPSPSCWREKGHGDQDAASAIMNSCNFYFFEVGFRLATKGQPIITTEDGRRMGKYSDSQGIRLLKNTGDMFGFNENTGIEISEAEPLFAETDAVRAAIGYGHRFTCTELSRYATALGTCGNVMKYTLISKITDKDGVVTYDSQPQIVRQITNISSNEWKQIKNGMQRVITNSTTLRKAYSIIPYTVAAKTGTAEVSDNNAPHGLCISFAPMDNPETSVVAVIANGYSGTNAALVANGIYKRYYNVEEEVDIGEVIKVGD